MKGLRLSRLGEGAMRWGAWGEGVGEKRSLEMRSLDWMEKRRLDAHARCGTSIQQV